jgi:hypothetical protein
VQGFSEIGSYWSWQLERLDWLGLVCQILAVFAFLSIWWLQDRAWRILRWLFATYFLALALLRFGTWFLYGTLSLALTEDLARFMPRSGIAGLILCTATIAFLIADNWTRWVRFTDFGPESWNATKPSRQQWFGLAIALIALWSPFIPSPVHVGATLFTFGFPTSFGLTLTPTLLFLAGLIIAGAKKPGRVAPIFLGLATILSALVVDPITLHGIVWSICGLWLMIPL